MLELVEEGLQAEIEKLGVELEDVRSVVLYDFGPERAAGVFHELEGLGLLVRRDKVEERAEQIAQERLEALRQDHGIAV